LPQFFSFARLPDYLKVVSEPFHALASKLVAKLPRNPERTVALRKVLEGKRCAVRTAGRLTKRGKTKPHARRYDLAVNVAERAIGRRR
jgi:hypothetical protein